MSVPALQHLRHQFPGAHIAILAKPWVAGLYSNQSFCDELIPFHAGRRKLAGELRRGEFDCAVLLPNAFDAALLVWLARIPERIGYARDGRGIFLTRSIARPKPGETPAHQRFYYLELLRRAKLIDSYDSPSIRLEATQAKQPVVGVSPGAAYGGAKRWLPERFAEAAARVANGLNASISIFGSAEEFAICEEVRARLALLGQEATNFAGRTTLAEFVDLAGACEVFLTNDSGPMHIASALGVPTVAIFGATDDVATGPTGSASVVVRHPVECSPCLLRECPIDHRCMTGVSAGAVADAATELLERNRNTVLGHSQ